GGAQVGEQGKAAGKIVLVGEQGNTGMNWDPRSALRMRIRLWAGLFRNIGLVFWNTSWSMFGMNGGVYVPNSVANIYLGPEERGYTAVLGSWANRLPPGMTPTVFESSAPDQVRVWGLSSPQAAVAYLHHYKT